MSRKPVHISEDVHRKLKLASVETGKPMGKLVAEAVELLEQQQREQEEKRAGSGR